MPNKVCLSNMCVLEKCGGTKMEAEVEYLKTPIKCVHVTFTSKEWHDLRAVFNRSESDLMKLSSTTLEPNLEDSSCKTFAILSLKNAILGVPCK